MANTLKRIQGTDVEAVFSTAATGATPVLNWTEIDVTRKIGENEDSSAGSEFEQFSKGKRRADIVISGFEGGAENFSDLPEEGAEIKSLSCETTVEGEELMGEIADETKYGKIIVIEVNAKRTDKPSTWTIKARSGGH